MQSTARPPLHRPGPACRVAPFSPPEKRSEPDFAIASSDQDSHRRARRQPEDEQAVETSLQAAGCTASGSGAVRRSRSRVRQVHRCKVHGRRARHVRARVCPVPSVHGRVDEEGTPQLIVAAAVD